MYDSEVVGHATVTVISSESGHVVPPTAYVIVAEPAATPDTTPVDSSTVATDVLSEDHTPPVVPSEEIVVVSPVSIDVVPDNVPADGLLTVATTSPEPVQPNEFVAESVYVVVDVFDAVGAAIDASSKPVDGDQE